MKMCRLSMNMPKGKKKKISDIKARLNLSRTRVSQVSTHTQKLWSLFTPIAAFKSGSIPSSKPKPCCSVDKTAASNEQRFP